MSDSNALITALGLTTMIENDNLPSVIVEENGQANIAQDFDKARSNLKVLVDKSMQVVNELHDLAKVSESDKYYRVLNETMKTAIDANMGLMGIHQTLRETTVIQQPVQEQNITTNQLFFGSTADLQQIMENMNSGKQIERYEESE